jgi:trk system potassium uptake protein
MKFGIIGLGRFGYQIAKVLAENGMEVLAIDSNDSIVSSIRDTVTQAICMRVTDETSLRSVGFQDMDVVVIGMGENFAQSILVTALAKKHLNIPLVITRAINDIHCEILTLVGADRIILPEKEVGINLAYELSAPFFYIARLSNDFLIGKIEVPQQLIGTPIGNDDLLKSYQTVCIGIQRDETFIASTAPKFSELTLEADDKLILAGYKANLSRLAKL